MPKGEYVKAQVARKKKLLDETSRTIQKSMETEQHIAESNTFLPDFVASYNT